MSRFFVLLAVTASIVSFTEYSCTAQYVAQASGGGAENRNTEDADQPGAESPVVWYIGAEFGGTYASFGPGPISFYTIDAASAVPRVESTVERGSGYGHYFAAAVEMPYADYYGFACKLHYQTREADFQHTTPNVLMPVEGGSESVLATLHDEARLEITTFGVEILARIHHPDLPSVYALVGPSITWALADDMRVTQTIMDPDDVYYIEPGAGSERKLRSVSASGSEWGFESFFPDLVLGLGWTAFSAGDVRFILEAYYTLPLNGMPDHDEIYSYPDGSHLFTRQNPPQHEQWDHYNPHIMHIHAGIRVGI